MTNMFMKSGLLAASALCVLTGGAGARAADIAVERQRVANVYEACYGESCHGPNGYERQFNGCRPGNPCPDDCDNGRCWCRHCCCHNFMSPGSVHPSRCLDICLYRIVFPISPWYSHPRDGILYPAYGSRAPTCNPITH